MKHRIIHIVQIIIAIVITGFTAQANNVLHIQTNKKLYVSGENIGFKCTLTDLKSSENSILHVDLCGENYIITSRIFQRENSHWQGTINIPDSVQTGVYLLRTYFGNNLGEHFIEAKIIPVINQFGNNSVNESQKNHKDYTAIDNNFFEAFSNSHNGLSIEANKQLAETNDSVLFTIKNSISEAVGEISFSVFKTHSQKNTNITYKANNIYIPDDNIKIYNCLTISGCLTNSTTGLAAPNETMLLSIPDSIPQIAYAKTDSSGVFNFNLLKYYNTQDAIIQTVNKDEDYTITLFSPTLLPPQTIPFYIDTKTEKSDFATLSQKRTIMHKAYSDNTLENSTPPFIEKYPFYGYTPRVVYPAKYVDLNDFKEIAWEILPIVKYRSSADSVYIRIWDSDYKMFFNNPLLIVDGIPVFDPASINVLSSTDIKKIEIQPQNRCYGDLPVNGVISINTYKGDFSIVKMPLNAIRTQIETFYYQTKSTIKPMFRDILHWDPWLCSNTKTHKIVVHTSLEKGNYAAVAQTFDKQGNLHRSVFNFIVE